MKPAAIWTMPIDDPPVKYTYRTADEWFNIIKHLDEENRDNLMKAILVFLGENK